MKKLLLTTALMLAATPAFAKEYTIKEVTSEDGKYYFEPKTGFMLIDSLLSDQKGAFLDALHHLILPMIVLGTVPLAVIARMTRSSMLEVLSEDYVRTARAKGLPENRIVLRHALGNALVPIITVYRRKQ